MFEGDCNFNKNVEMLREACCGTVQLSRGSLLCAGVLLFMLSLHTCTFRRLSKSHKDLSKARLEKLTREEGNIEAPISYPHISTSSDVFAIALDQWIDTICVQIGMGDLVLQHTQAIVNPANSHLNQFGGAACAIADAAGNDLISVC